MPVDVCPSRVPLRRSHAWASREAYTRNLCVAHAAILASRPDFLDYLRHRIHHHVTARTVTRAASRWGEGSV
jgi:hypothetical protein